eukprot:CAMPEP_0168584298 /NCGR_PEP_ID=MMETSP0420-20121227/3059_1 /TAXON_ID=498008 /ORGANISM="Pessonella sp." /LENGTH=237 /DNA_ID=CAMNT_0008619079 /DNA_START=32 /DNA_END=742 /DNA_ORIENTATION=-
MKYLLQETAIHKMCTHANIVKFYKGIIVKDTREFWMLMEHIDGCTAEDLRVVKGFAENDIAHIVAGLVRALVYLHFLNIVHRDIKCTNVLVAKRGSVKLCDFGLAALLTSERPRRNSLAGTASMMAPEILKSEEYDTSVDVWALGMVILRLADVAPYPPHVKPETVLKILNQQGIPNVGPKWSGNMAKFIAEVLTIDASKRPSPSVLLQHDWLMLAEIGDNFTDMVVKAQRESGNCV